MKDRLKPLTVTIAVVILIEMLCATYLLRNPAWSKSLSLIYFFSGITISLVLLFLPQISFENYHRERRNFFSWTIIILIPLTAAYCFYYTQYWIRSTPLSYEYADMLPVIKVMNERFLSGHFNQVYQPISEIWGGSQPGYYPAMWLPYCVGVLTHIDLRWINSFALFSSFVICLVIASKVKNLCASAFFIIAFLLLVTWLYKEPVHNYIRLTEEGVVVLYYMFLVLAIISGKPVWTGIALGLCLLSRFSIIGWIPAISIYFLLQKKFRELLLIGGSCVLTVLVLFIIPFGWSTVLHVMQRSSAYMSTASNVWNVNPEYFTNFLGFARFYMPGHLHLLHYSLIACSFGLPILFVLLVYFLRKKFAANNVLLATGKLSLVTFYSFIYVPYLYLFYTSSMVSLLILAFLARGMKKESTNS